ncbi:MAG: glucose-6-phosphate dehydrogenase (NADP(+)), partial [Ktedonobacteraceae bacterium]|nr:glucose-6-phosphate dehydrogenase (NADP(+)) [Ktedonobacteraceae bacterium]
MVQEVQAQGVLKQHSIWQNSAPPEPCAVIIFGATGDLTQRKLLPTLAHLAHDHPLPEGFCVVAFARRPLDDEKWRAMALESINTYMPADDKLTEEAQQQFAQRLFYCRSDFNNPDGYHDLAQLLDKLEREHGTKGNRLFYLATPPETDSMVIENIGKAGLTQQQERNGYKSWARVIVEKPFGHDLATAQKLNSDLASVFQENQIYRVDHYMGKETVQNILALRFANRIFEPLWNQRYIDHVQILVAESIGIGTRAEYYESEGAIRDMVQNHIMQVLCLTCMEPPVAFDADAIRDE